MNARAGGVVLIIVSFVVLVTGMVYLSPSLESNRGGYLWDSLKSGASESEIRAYLTQYRLHDMERTKANDHYKSHAIVVVEDYKTKSASGELLLEFHDDQLYAVCFFPTNRNVFLDELKTRGTTLKLDQEIYRHGVQILATTDALGKFYVRYQDVQLGNAAADDLDK